MTFTRRGLFGLAAAAAAWPLATFDRAGAGVVPRPAPLDQGRYVVVNADDFGESDGINEGVIEAHRDGIVTSASLMVDAPRAEAAVTLRRRFPRLGLGLHVALAREGPHGVDLDDLGAVAVEIERQARRFVTLTGHRPTHIDSHHHVHQRFNVARLFLELGARYHAPVRGFSRVVYVGRFYGEWTPGKTDLGHISGDYLVAVLHSLRTGVSEVSCHPGHVDPRSDPGYNGQREVELRALTDPRVKAAVQAEGLRLINYAEYAAHEPPTLAGATLAACPESTRVTRR